MIQRSTTRFFTVFLAVFVLTACSKDDDDDGKTPDDSDDQPAQVSDPADLETGAAEFTASGSETFIFTNATSNWRRSGSFTSGIRTYAYTDVTLLNESEDTELTLTFNVYDPDATAFSGELPAVGSYGFDYNFQELASDSIDKFAEVYLWSESFENSFGHNQAEGEIVITSFEDGVMEGYVNLNGMTGSGETNATINLAASFKAEEY